MHAVPLSHNDPCRVPTTQRVPFSTAAVQETGLPLLRSWLKVQDERNPHGAFFLQSILRDWLAETLENGPAYGADMQLHSRIVWDDQNDEHHCYERPYWIWMVLRDLNDYWRMTLCSVIKPSVMLYRLGQMYKEEQSSDNRHNIASV